MACMKRAAVARLPLVAILQGGKGEGLFSATYSIKGDLNEPKIDVNAWSALAPGFLRNLFEGDSSSGLTPPTRVTPKN